jgi:tRNA (cytidine56-2'-O)-methyltransferase
MTTHVGLTARALGADRVVFAGEATDALETVRDVTDRFGGPFTAELTEQPRAILRDFEGSIVHLTMYGERIEAVESELRDAHREGPLLVVVGAEKVSFDVYEHADWNVGVTNQPHSEVAALAVVLDRLYEGRELDREWVGARRRVLPQERGKRVEDVTGDDVPGDGDHGESGKGERS